MSDKKYTMKDWLSGEIGVLVETEKEYDAMIGVAQKNGIRWGGGDSPEEYVPPIGKCNTILFADGGLTFGGPKWLENEGGTQCVRYKNLAPDRPSYALHITSDGSTTFAVLKQNGKVTQRSMAACHPDDKYDFLIGARAALDRMQGKKPLSLEDVPTDKLMGELFRRKGPFVINYGGSIEMYVREENTK